MENWGFYFWKFLILFGKMVSTFGRDLSCVK